MAAARGATMSCERCGHEIRQVVLRDPSGLTMDITGIGHPESECIANLRADLAEARKIYDRLLAEGLQVQLELEAERARSVSIRDHTLEEAARVADEHWPENGHVHDVGVLSCQATISALIRRRRGSIPRAFVDEEELKAERGRSWEGWQQAEHYERLSFDFITGAMPSYAERIDHEKVRRREAERELEAERARSWELRVEAYLEALQNAAMRAVLTLHDDWANMPNPQFVEKHGEYITETVLYERTRCALATDAGRHLLTAVRRLCEVAEEVRAKLADGRFFVGSEERDLREALADPALAGLQGTGPKVAHDDSDRKRD